MLEPKRAPAAPNAIASTDANTHASRVHRSSAAPTCVSMKTTKQENARSTAIAVAKAAPDSLTA